MVQSIKVVMDAASFSVNDKQKLLALVQSSQGSDDDMNDSQRDSMRELGAPAPKAYESKSGGIVDTLTTMKEDAEAQLAELRKAETKSKQNFEVLKLALSDEIDADKTEMAEEKQNKQEADETKAAAEGDLAVPTR